MPFRLNPRRLPLRLIRLGADHPKVVLLVAIAAGIACAALMTRVRIESDILALIPSRNQAVQDFRTTVEQFGSADFLLVGVELDHAEDIEAHLEFTELLVEELDQMPEVSWLECNLRDFSEAALELYEYAALFLGPEELDIFLEKFNQAGTQRAAEDLATQIRSPLEFGLNRLRQLDPMGVLPLISRSISFTELGPRFDRDTGYLIDRDREFLLILVKPVKPAVDIPFCHRLMAGLSTAESRAADEWSQDDWGVSLPKVVYGGGYAIALEDSKMIVSDMITGVLSALIGVTLLFAFAFHRVRALAIAMVPLFCGLLLTLAFAALALGRINTATSAFAALLIGLGIDFVIVLYGRYLEERSSGSSHESALTYMGKNTALGVLLGAVTTGATFYAFLVSDFKGLSELGLLTGTGILILVICVFILFSALLSLLEKKASPFKRGEIRDFGLHHICAFSTRHPKAVILVAGAVTVILGGLATRVRYDQDILNMRSTENAGVQNQQRMMDAFGMRFTPLMIRVDGESEAEAFDSGKQLASQLEAFVDGEHLAKINSVVSMFPDFSRQQAVLDRLQSIDFDADAFRRRFSEALTQNGLNPRAFSDGIDRLIQAVTQDRVLSVGDLQDSHLGHLMSRYVHLDEDAASVLIYAYLPAGKWRLNAPPPVRRIVDANPNAILTGPTIISQELKVMVWRDAFWAAILGMIVVFLFLRMDLGSSRSAWLALLPLGVGMIWMVGLMGAFGFDVNFMNIFVFTMLIGIGVDYGIHLTHRWRETDGHRMAIVATSRAIAVAALTTMIGFGSLITSHYPGLRSMGAAAILGASATALVCLSLLPAILVLHQRKTATVTPPEEMPHTRVSDSAA